MEVCRVCGVLAEHVGAVRLDEDAAVDVGGAKLEELDQVEQHGTDHDQEDVVPEIEETLIDVEIAEKKPQ